MAMRKLPLGILRRFIAEEFGAASVLMICTLPMFLSLAGLAIDGASAFRTQTILQSTADIAALAAVVDLPSTSTATSDAVLYAQKNLPTSGNGTVLATGDVATGNWNSTTRVFTANGTPLNAVSVTVRRAAANGNALPTSFLMLIGKSSWDVAANAIAATSNTSTPCLIALSGAQTGVTLSGGTSISAPQCSVASASTVSVPCGTTITTIAVTYDSAAAPSEPCGGIVPPAGTSSVSITKAPTSDPFSGSTAVATATARLTTVGAIANPSAPVVSTGGDISFGYSPAPTIAQVAADGCVATVASPLWTVTCANGGTYKFGNITLAGGISVNFNTGGSASTTYDFSGQIDDGGAGLSFGPGTYNIAHGVSTSGGGSTTTFGAGTFHIGPIVGSCNGATNYSICNTATALIFAGPSTFVLSGGIYTRGGSMLTLGSSGSTNSFDIGAASSGDSFNMGGGSQTIFGDATGASSVFELAGNLNITSGGGSCLQISAAAEHDIDGFFSTAGGTVLGAGVYTVAGYVWLGGGGGGDVTCWGQTIGISGSGATFVIGGAHTPTSGTCAGSAFCVAAGYGHVTITAPTAGSLQGFVVIGPDSAGNTNGATFTEGASNTSLSGVFYFPDGAITLGGGASVGGGTGQCLELVATALTLSGGSAVGSDCVVAGGASGGAANSIKLVQ
jgi:Flp pilus assembly protein TadG